RLDIVRSVSQGLLAGASRAVGRGAGPVGRGAGAARGGRRRRRLRAVLAVRRLVALGALRLVLPALREVLHEGVQRLLLALGLERLLDPVLCLAPPPPPRPPR